MPRRMGRPRQFPHAMKKTSVALPEEAIEALKEGAKRSGFHHWSEQLRYEILFPRGLWKPITPWTPTQEAPVKA